MSNHIKNVVINDYVEIWEIEGDISQWYFCSLDDDGDDCYYVTYKECVAAALLYYGIMNKNISF